MCGICGTIGIEKDRAVRTMAESLLHRGPDGSGIWNDGDVFLAHTRLAIIDTSKNGRQPMTNKEGALCISYNGEIYNFRELKKDLEAVGHRFVSHTDTEVVLHLYDEYKEKCLDKMRGMFSFAIWDSKRKRLFAARDRFGVKPFFYYCKERKFIFSSELRPMLSSGLVPRKIDMHALAGYFTYGSVQSPASIIEGVFQLEPAHYLYFENGRLDIKRYWEPPLPAEVKMDEDSYIVGMKDILDESVRIRLVGDVPVGIFLSGGLDSSAIAGLAQKNSSLPVKTFSVAFAESEYDESRFSDAVSRKFGTDHTRIRLDETSLVGEMPAILNAMDEPSADGFNTFIISKAVHKSGMKVALSGLGADELFGGYRFFKTLPAAAGALRSANRLPASWRKLLFGHVPMQGRRRSLDKLLFLLAEAKDIRDLYKCQRSVFLPQEIKNLLDTGDDVLFCRSGFDSDEGDIGNLLSLLEINGYLQNTLLHDTDRMSMANSLEVRTPFLDHILAEKIFQVPGKHKTCPGRPKRLLAEAVQDMMPREVLNRTKKGFVLPFDRWMRHDLKGFCEEILSSGNIKNIPALKYAGVKKIWDEFLYHPGSRNYSSVLTLISFVNWHRENIQ